MRYIDFNYPSSKAMSLCQSVCLFFVSFTTDASIKHKFSGKSVDGFRLKTICILISFHLNRIKPFWFKWYYYSKIYRSAIFYIIRLYNSSYIYIGGLVIYSIGGEGITFRSYQANLLRILTFLCSGEATRRNQKKLKIQRFG